MDTFPQNVMGMIVVTSAVVGLFFWFLVSQALDKLPVASTRKNTIRIGLAAFLVTWYVTAFVITNSEFYVREPGNLIWFGLSAALPIIVSVTLILQSRTVQAIAEAIPTQWLIGVQLWRTMGVLFLVLADMGLLPQRFANPSGYGDVLVGLAAPLVAYWYVQRRPFARELAIMWNVLGLLDFASAFFFGITTDPALYTSPLVLARVQLIPLFPVALFTMLHLFTLRGLLVKDQTRMVQVVALGS